MYGTLGYGTPEFSPTQFVLAPLYAAKWKTFVLNTGIGNQAISGIGFQPKFVLFFWTSQVNINTKEVGMMEGMSAAVSSTNRYGYFQIFRDNDAIPYAKKRISDNGVIIEWDNTDGSVDATVDFVSMDVDGFTLNVTSALSAIYVHALCLGGSEFEASIEQIAVPAATGSQDYTGAGFQPDAVMAITSRLGTYDLTSANIYRDIGFADKYMHQYNLWYRSRDGTAPPVPKKLHYNDALITTIGLTADTVAYRAILTAMLANGITLNWTDISGTPYVTLIYLKGGGWKVGYFDTPSQTGFDWHQITISGATGLSPRMVLFNGSKLSGFDSGTAGINCCIGGATSQDSRGCTHVHGSDVGGVTETSRTIFNDRIFSVLDDDGVNEIAAGDIDNFWLLGFSLNWLVSTESGKKVSYLAWGDATFFWIPDGGQGGIMGGETVRTIQKVVGATGGMVAGGSITPSVSNIWSEKQPTSAETWTEEI